ncbi:MAG: hypothetical protein PWP64_319 [Candidatus Cloacimonadota bacterium]|nr:hypothetical protein [Candidatus Cloacimonadota bacterium]
MKANSFCLVILLLSCSFPLFAQTREVEFYLYDSDSIRLLESSLGYQMTPYKYGTMNIISQSSWEERLNFNQETRKSMLGSSFSYHKYALIHTLFLDYESYFNSSDLDPNAYINKNGTLGYRLHWIALDSLNLSLEAHGLIRNEQDRYLVGNHLKSQGLQLLSHASYGIDGKWAAAGLSADWEQKKMDWEAYQVASANANINISSPNLLWDNSFDISHRSDDIYNLYTNEAKQNSQYQKQDTQTRNSINIFSRADYFPHPKLNISMSENYWERKTKLDNNIVRNNGEFYNHLDLNVDYEVRPQFSLGATAAHHLAIKDFSYAQNTRHIENRSLAGTAAWEYAAQDSLITALSIDLQRTSFPRNENRWDNDLRTRTLRLGWKHYYRDRIRLNNWFIYSIREDVYMDSLLSANNHRIESFSFLPEINTLLGDRLAFRQNYQIRADYTDFYYDSDRENNLYRQLGYGFHLIFDSYPYIARSGDEKWLQLPYRSNRGSAIMIDLGYTYEENQYADRSGDYYDINNKNRKHLANLIIKHNIADFYYSLSPQYIWGTWQEYSLVAVTNWDFNQGSNLEISLAPVSEDLKTIDWRTSIHLNLRF